MEKTICNICRYQPETDTLIGTIEDTITLLANNNLQHVFIATRNWYIYLDDIRRYHCIIWEKIIWMICINLPETCLLGWECFPLYTKGNFPMYREILTIILKFLINYCTLINIFSTQLWFYQTDVHINTHTHTKTHTHITDGSIFISELLPLKLEVWWSQLEMFKWVIKTHLRKERSSQKQP